MTNKSVYDLEVRFQIFLEIDAGSYLQPEAFCAPLPRRVVAFEEALGCASCKKRHAFAPRTVTLANLVEECSA
jgi:hypothetical protein